MNTRVVGSKILGQYGSIRIGVVTANNHDCGNSVFFADVGRDRELFLRFQFRSSRTDNIKTARVAVLVDVFVVEYEVVVVDQPAWPVFKAKQLVVRVRRFQRVVQTADDVMAARGLPTGKNDTHHLFFGADVFSPPSNVISFSHRYSGTAL